MGSSDDEGVIVAKVVTEYYFVDGNEEPISFCKLPIHWDDGDSMDGSTIKIFLCGKVDDGLQKIFEQISAWKFDLSLKKPEIAVLTTKDKNWIKLLKPRNSFETTIRTILIAVHCLHFLKNNPAVSRKSLWDHLAKVFSLYERRPSVNDLVDHITLISEAIQREESLKKSEFLLKLVEEQPRRTRISDKDTQVSPMSGFIVDDIDNDATDDTEEDVSDEEEETYDSVCAFCDNGGNLLCCEGRCMRSFHATEKAGRESQCISLGLTKEEVEAIPNYLCKNCQYQQHQCFSCGKLGSSDRSAGAEVFQCVSATCGYFYHPQCVAKLLHREDEAAAKDLKEKIADGESFLCPIHKCRICKQGEVKTDTELQLAVCRRCPTSYHRRCFPRRIVFEDDENEGVKARAWDGLLPNNRILIYCLKHEINDDLDTPDRDHIEFPGVENKKNIWESELHNKDRSNLKKSSLASADFCRSEMKAQKLVKPPSAVKRDDYTKKAEKVISGSGSLKKMKETVVSRKSLPEDVKYVSDKVGKKSSLDENKASLGERLFVHKNKSKRQGIDNDDQEWESAKPAVKKLKPSTYQLDVDSEQRISDLIKEAASTITLEEIMKKHKGPSTHAYSSKDNVDKIKQGKVEGAVEALRTALQKIDAGCSIKDAKDVCEPSVLHNVYYWKDKLRVYLAPFLHGMRYTSFGRHFTKVDKLEKIADKLQFYISNGDTIVDFCCGANDFSCILKTKLDETGKKCSYRNYDILQAKNDFNFEKRDWMTVQPYELPTGSQLIMGLNPPFGVKSALANKFIDKALKFKPKLLILIVPPQTERLDAKDKIRASYDLIWEDNDLLSGKSFYLPGSVDENDKQMDQWNSTTPPLYLWSRSDWTARHMDIAQKHGHISKQLEESRMEENNFPMEVLDPPVEDHDGYSDLPRLLDDHIMQIEEPSEPERMAAVSQCLNEDFSSRNNIEKIQESHGRVRNDFSEDSRKIRRGKEHHEEGTGEVSVDNNQNGGRPGMNDWDMPLHSPRYTTNGRSALEDHSSHSIASRMGFGEDQQRFQSSVSRSGLHVGTSYGGTGTGTSNDVAGRYGFKNRHPYPSGTPGYNEHPYPSGTPAYNHPYQSRTPRYNEPCRSGTPRYNEPHQSGTPGYNKHSYPSQAPGYNEHPHMSGATGWSSGITTVAGFDNFGYRPYASGMDQRDSEIHSLVQDYGRQDPDPHTQRGGYLPGHESGYNHTNPLPLTYGHHGLAAEPSYGRMNTSTMERYAPHLNEINYTRMNSLGSEPPMGSRNGMHEYPQAQPRPRPGSLGFAYGAPHTFAQQSSSGGWLNE